MPDDVSPDVDSRTVDDLITKMLSGGSSFSGSMSGSDNASSMFKPRGKTNIPPLSGAYKSPRIPLPFDPREYKDKD